MSQFYSGSGELRPQSDVVSEHTMKCSKCLDAMGKPPVPNLNPLGMGVCSELLGIFQWYANYEGEINNIVNHDEYGNFA